MRTSNFAVEGETKGDVSFFLFFLCVEPVTFLGMFFRNHERFKCNDSLSISFSLLLLFFLANSLYCSSTVENDKRIIA